MNNKFNLLELFKGTGSVGKVAKDNFNIISLDYDNKFTPDINIDILNWDYKKHYKDTNFLPNVIWASPPCNTFSPLAYALKERNITNANPISERAQQGTNILYKTLEIIQFYKKKNPNLLYIIENPLGMMRRDRKMKKIPFMTLTYYCFYQDNRYKPTNFWSNFELKLKTGKPKECFKNGRKLVRVARDIPLRDRYIIPHLLVEDIINQTLLKLQI